MKRLVLALVLAAAAIVTASGCSAAPEPAGSSPATPAPTSQAPAAPSVLAAAERPTEAMQRAVADELQRTLGVGSGNGPSADDPTLLVVSVFAERDELDDDRVAAAEREVARLAAAEGFRASFVYGASDGS